MQEYLNIAGTQFVSDSMELLDNNFAGQSNIDFLLEHCDYSQAIMNDNSLNYGFKAVNHAIDCNGKAFNPAEKDIIIVTGNGYTGNYITNWTKLFLNVDTMQDVIEEIEQDTILSQDEYDFIEKKALEEYVFSSFENDISIFDVRGLNHLLKWYSENFYSYENEMRRESILNIFFNSAVEAIANTCGLEEEYGAFFPAITEETAKAFKAIFSFNLNDMHKIGEI